MYTDDLSNVDGSPFLNDTFLPGTIYFDNQNLYANVRYDVVKENMQVQLKNEEYILKYGIKVDILGKKYRQFNYRRNDKMMVGYFEVLTEGDSPALSLLKKPLKKLKEGQAAGAMRPAKDPRYVDKTDFYLSFESSTYAVPVERRTKKFIKIFPKEHQDQIKEFMNEKV
ncbi:hypothetical protein [Longispora fulva]|uniref:hypothetical protein n=1 Tax=Longispora fulva TaxID=619741 RepID=UPI003635FF69